MPASLFGNMASLSFDYSFGYIPGFTKTDLVTQVESQYISVKVYPLFFNKVIVEWGVPASIGDCTFNVFKGDTESGPWILANPHPLRGTNFFEDLQTKDYSKFHKSYYIVEVTLPLPDGRSIKSAPTSWDHKRTNLMDIRAREITRRESILLSKFIGVDTKIYRRKFFGARCPACYNEAIEKVTKDNCSVCYGTSFLGGYFPGILTKVNFDVSPNDIQLSYQGKVESNQTTAWTTSFPSIMSLDILIRTQDFKIFRIDKVNATEIQTVALRQVMQVTELPKNSIEMNLLKEITPAKYSANNVTGNKVNTTAGYTI